MKLLKLKFKSSGLFLLTIDDNSPIFLDDMSVYRLGLKEGMDISDELFEKICTISGREGAKRAAARILTAGRKSEAELRQKLRLKGFSAEDIDAATEMFVKNGILNDDDYAKSYIKDAINLKKYSVRMIRQKLALKGIDRETVQRLTAELDDFAQLYYLIESELKKCPDKKGIEKLKRRLLSKGFGLWDINKVLGEFEYEA